MTLCVQRPPTVCVAPVELIVNRPAEYVEKVGQTAKGYYIDAPIAQGTTVVNLGKTVASETVQFATDPLGTSIHYGKIAIGLADTVADAVYHYDQTWNSIEETASSLPKTIDDWIVHTPLDKQGQFFGEIGWSIPIGRAFELAFTRALSAARWVDDVVPDATGPAPNRPGHYTDFADEAAGIMDNATHSRGLNPGGGVRAMAAPIREVEISKLIPPPTRSVADAAKVERLGKFNWDLYRPIHVEDHGGRLIIMDGMTRLEAARRAGITKLPVQIFPKTGP